MNGLTVKKCLAFICDIALVNRVLLWRLNKRYKSDYIRVVNYHETEEASLDNFERQIKWYLKKFQNVNEKKFVDYMDGKTHFYDKPGIMLTFDDGYEGNYLATKKILDKYEISGYFFVSADLVGKEGYMSWEQLKELVDKGHIVGCHTATHHRMNQTDTEEILKKEIIESKGNIEKNLNKEIPYFCWCGGEEEHYTKTAADMIRSSGYRYGFMTNSFPLTCLDDKFQIERINVESTWKLSLVRFQLSGIMDRRFRDKRQRVERMTK